MLFYTPRERGIFEKGYGPDRLLLSKRITRLGNDDLTLAHELVLL